MPEHRTTSTYLRDALAFEFLAAELPRFSWLVRRRLRRQAAFLRKLHDLTTGAAHT